MGARLVVASFGGFCIALSFPPVACWPAVFVGVAALLWATSHTTYGASLILGWVGGCVGHIVAFAWLWKVIDAFTGGSPAVVIGCVVAFVGYHALQLALFTFLAAACVPRNPAFRCATAASVWVAVEWSFPKLIPWTLGDGLSPSLLLRQAADLTGPQGLSFAIATTAAALASFSGADGRRHRRCSLAVAFGVVAVWTIYGSARLWQFEAGASGRLRVTLVQGGLGLNPDARQQNDLAWKIYEPLTLAAAARAQNLDIGQLVVWPEATLRAYLRVDEGQRRRVRRLLSLLHQPLMIGALDLPASGIGELNAAYLFTAAGSRSPAVQTYHKRRLIPFAEYIPGNASVASLLEWRPIGNFVVGEDGPPLEVQRGVQLAPAICFEVLQPGVFNRMVHDGATLLVNLSDDAWFAGTTEVRQHLAMSVMRAVETRRWLARASDSGISAFIDPAGRIVAKLDEGVIGAIQKTVALERALSPYVRFGNWIAPACFMLLAGHGLVAAGKRLRAIAAR